MIFEVVGTAGACLLLLAYLLVSSGRLALDNMLGHVMNLGGSVMLGANAIVHGAIPPAMLNLIWAVIAIVAMVRRRPAPNGASSTGRPPDGPAG
jgi:hypothetical protein